jgi:hypothetical protein
MSILEKVMDAVSLSHDTGPNAIALLKQDHDDVSTLFDEYDVLAEDENASSADKRTLSTQICGMLAVHAIIEEELFYPAARAAGVDASLLNEAEVEHGSAKELIAQIGASQPSDALYDARVKVLGEYIAHHVQEEEGELFPACRKAEMNLDEIGLQLQQRKEDLMRQLNAK